MSPLGEAVSFNVVLDPQIPASPTDVKELTAFHRQALKLQRAVNGANGVAGEVTTRLNQIRQALDVSPKADEAAKTQVRDLIAASRAIVRALRGDSVLRARNENVPESISDRVAYAMGVTSRYLGKPTGTQKESYAIASKEFAAELAKLRNSSRPNSPRRRKSWTCSTLRGLRAASRSGSSQGPIRG